MAITGVLDDSRVTALRTWLNEAVAAHRAVAVDLSGGRLTGTRWMAVLLEAERRARACRHAFAVVSPKAEAARLCLPVLARGGRLVLCQSLAELPPLSR
uniref:Uncharacterized protein n=1 Tax=Nonomuraea gerenzanensis TaxID=93944 RepID=A0A1M4EAT9_9ACTN|nr:hypothetical protein BN4615_P5583 [Nonomuraea gerenzanensis]